jgi:rsbT antagonist protein RsbS
MTEGLPIPIIQLDGVLIVSIQVALSDRLVAQLKEDVTARIELVDPRGLAIDVSGIDIMDSYISRNLRDIGLMARLMGVPTVISGMDPMIAMTLVEMGLDLEGVSTARNLDGAMRILRRRERRSRKPGGRTLTRRR